MKKVVGGNHRRIVINHAGEMTSAICNIEMCQSLFFTRLISQLKSIYFSSSHIQVQKYLFDLRSLVSLRDTLDVMLLGCLWILERLRFSFPLSHSLSDVRSVSLLALRTFTTAWVQLLDVSSAGACVNKTEIFTKEIPGSELNTVLKCK